MALTNYRAYKWLIELLDEYPDQKYGMSRAQIEKAYLSDYKKIYNTSIPSGKTRTGITSQKKVFLKDSTEEVVLTNKTLINWRNAIWKEFGLIIWHPVIRKKVNRIINGVKKEVEEESSSNTYIIYNRELLDQNKTLRETLEHLVEDEQRGYVSKSPFTAHVKGRPKSSTVKDATMGFVSIRSGEEYPDYQLGYHEEPEMLDIVRFSMSIGEALVIKVGTKNMVLESQELKQINGRWYVIGNQYEYGDEDKESSQLVVHDVELLNLSDDEDVVSPMYKVVKEFNSTHLMPWDWNEHFSPDKVVSLYIKVNGLIFENRPFSDTQMNLGNYSQTNLPQYIYKIYVKPNKNFLLPYLAYDGTKVKVCEAPDDKVKSDTDITEEQINYLRSIKRGKK